MDDADDELDDRNWLPAEYMLFLRTVNSRIQSCGCVLSNF
jgi:hypothetical protein